MDWIKDHPSCALWVDMGLGKTVATLTAVLDLINDFEVNRVLVIAPLRVARKVWQDEIEVWSHVNGLTHSRIVGTQPQRLKAMRKNVQVYTINRENTQWLVAQHFNSVAVKRKGGKPVLDNRGNPVMKMGSKQIRPWIWDTVVLDESSSFKNQASERWKALRRVRRLFDRCIQLTGTPSPNGLMDLWAQMYLLDKGKRLGATLTAFRSRWYEPPGNNQFKWKLKTAIRIGKNGEDIIDHWAEEQIHDRCKDLCVTLKAEDYLELPPVVYNNVKVTLSKSDMEKYKYLEKHYVLELEDEQITALNAGSLCGKLLQLANGAVYTEAPRWKVLHNEKLDALFEILDQANGPVIIAYNYRSDLERLSKALTKKKLNWRKLDTEKDEDDWNTGKIDYLVLHPQSAGHGLNLQGSGSKTIIWFGLNWSLELYQQTNARLIGGHRRGDRTVVIHHIISSGTVDGQVMAALSDKHATQDRLMQAMLGKVEEYFS